LQYPNDVSTDKQLYAAAVTLLEEERHLSAKTMTIWMILLAIRPRNPQHRQ
jgi:hypothetical protein